MFEEIFKLKECIPSLLLSVQFLLLQIQMSTSRRSDGAVLPTAASTFQRSASPSGRFYTSKVPDSSAFASSTGFSFCSSASLGLMFNRSASPTRVNLHGLAPPSVRISIDRSISPGRAMAMSSARNHHQVLRKAGGCKRTCLCSPTTHPGSFRCSLHKNSNNTPAQSQVRSHSNAYSLKNLTIQRSAMKNSLVRIGTVEGDLVKRALTALIRPSSHQIRRRADFQRKPSRFSLKSTAV